MKKINLISSVCIIIALCISLAAISYSWLRRDWHPTFEGTNIQIQTGSSLTIVLDNKNSTTEALNLHDILQSPDDFRLKQISNLTGKSEDFFGLEYIGTTVADARIVHLTVPSNMTNGEFAEAQGYVEKLFNLRGSGEDQEIYLYFDNITLNGTHISVPFGVDENDIENYQNAIESIRVSITIGGKTYGLKLTEDAHTGFTNAKDYTTGTPEYVAVGKNPPMWNSSTESFENNPNLSYVGEDKGSYQTFLVSTDSSSTNYFHSIEYYKTNMPTLAVIKADQETEVTVRIWLEGTAKGCTEHIAGLDFDIGIVFAGRPTAASEQ